MKLIYYITTDLFFWFILYWIKGYVFLDFQEVSSKKLKFLIPFHIIMSLIVQLVDQLNEDSDFILLLILLLILATYIVSVCVLMPNRRVRGCLQFPLEIGIGYSVIMVPYSLVYLLVGDMESLIDCKGYSLILDLLVNVIEFIFVISQCRKWNAFAKLARGKSLQKKERRTLNFCGFCMIILFSISLTIDSLGIPEKNRKLCVFLFMVIMLLLFGVIVTMVSQRNQRFEYQNIAEMNAYYLNAELEHFRSYEAAQNETRKVRHDMKNHLYVLKHLLENEKHNEAKEYLDRLTQQVEHINNPVVTGNEIVDSIINAKSAIAEQSGNRIETEGRISAHFPMEAIDLCTIFANAIDNGIEEMKRNHEKDATLEITMHRQNDMQMILFCNPAGRAADGKAKSGKTSKEDKLWHGFGLENIRETVERYHGITQITTEETKQGSQFVLQILIPLTTK